MQENLLKGTHLRIAAGNPTLFVPIDQTKIKWLTFATLAVASEEAFKFQHVELIEETVIEEINSSNEKV